MFRKYQNRSPPGDPTGGAYDAPPDPIVGWGGGNPSPFPTTLNAFGTSISATPAAEILQIEPCPRSTSPYSPTVS